MIDVEKYLQSAYDYGYRQGVKDTLDDIHKTLERSLREQFAHLIKTEPNSKVSETPTSSEKPNNCEDLQDWKDRMWAEAIVTEPTISKMEQVDEPQEVCDRPQKDCENCWKELHCRAKDEPQTDCPLK